MEESTSTSTSTSTAAQIAEPPPSATSYLADQRSSPAMVAAELPSLAVPAPPLIATTDPASRGRKRALEGNLEMENSNYYKLRLLVKDLRPQVLEVLRTPDFRNSKAAMEIQEKMKLMLQLYQEMIGGTPKREKTTKSQSLSNGKAVPQGTTTELRSSVQTDMHHSDGDAHKVVGGSAFGWNFITYGGTEAVYCGMSKEEYRASHPIIQAEVEVELHN